MGRPGKPGGKTERDELQAKMAAQGCTVDEVADEFRARWQFPPLAAYRYAAGLTQYQAASRYNEVVGDAAAGADNSLISKLELWPAGPGGKAPTAYNLVVLAVVYGTVPHRLVAPADVDKLPRRDQLVLQATHPQPPAGNGASMIRRTVNQRDAAGVTYRQRLTATTLEARLHSAPLTLRDDSERVLPTRTALLNGTADLAVSRSSADRGFAGNELSFGVSQATILDRIGLGRLLADMISPSPLNNRSESPCTVELIEQCELLTNSLRHLDYQLGSGAVYTGAVDHLDRMMSFADRVPSPLYRRFTLAVADIAQICGWLAIDQQDYPTARRHCALALASAEEGGDRALHAYVLGVMSYIHLHAGRGTEALRMLDGARTIAEGGVGVHPAVRSWLWEATGESYGLTGDRAAGATALHRAEVLFDRVEPTGVPGWLSFYNDGCHAVRLRGRCLLRIGDVSSAIKVLEESRALLPSHFVREHSGTLIDLAAAHLSEPEPERTVEVAGQALQLAVSTGSNRNQSRLRELLPGLAAYQTLPAVRELSERLR